MPLSDAVAAGFGVDGLEFAEQALFGETGGDKIDYVLVPPGTEVLTGVSEGGGVGERPGLAGEEFGDVHDVVREGLRALDRYTYRIVLTEPLPNLIYYLTYCNLMCAVAREVIEAYGDDSNSHPVGTGAYRLKHYVRSSKIVLEANPGYRERVPFDVDRDAQRALSRSS
mgnify:CR=1 FL=1